jgi:hypothetical protein
MNLSHLEKLTVTLLVEKFEAFRQPDGSLLRTQETTNAPRTEQAKTSPHPHVTSLRFVHIILPSTPKYTFLIFGSFDAAFNY